jgi:hypothetical protein
MTTNMQFDKQVDRVADAIVGLVERTDGPVTLARVHREVDGFAQHEPPFWAHVVRCASGEVSFWCEMSKAGLAAFQKVMDERRIAIQFVNTLPYVLDGCFRENENWQPIVLLPARAANLDGPKGLIRVPQEVQDQIARAAAEQKTSLRPLAPRYDGATADHFSDANIDL